MIYDRRAARGTLAPITADELWRRHGDFPDALIPVAEEAGVTSAAHPGPLAPDDLRRPLAHGHGLRPGPDESRSVGHRRVDPFRISAWILVERGLH
jgi:hypothetical protein